MEALLMLGGALIVGLFFLARRYDQDRRFRRHAGTDGSSAIFSDGGSDCGPGSDGGCSDGGGGGGGGGD